MVKIAYSSYCVYSNCHRSYVGTVGTKSVSVTRSQTCFCAVPIPTGKTNTSIVMTTDNTEAKSGLISKCVYTKF